MLENKAAFDKALVDAGDKLVVIDFTATWCGPCQMIAPKFQALSEEFGDVVFYKVDVDDNTETTEECRIQCMPTFQYFKNKAKIDSVEGADIAKLRSKVEQHK